MEHNKGQPTCLLCHLAVQPDEYVATALRHAKQPLFSRYRALFCHRSDCHQCKDSYYPGSYWIHKDCYRYYCHFLPKSQRLRLRDLLELWPKSLDFLAQQGSEREKHAFKEHFSRRYSELFAHTAKDGLGHILQLIAHKLPVELVLKIAEFSWPCALHKPAVIIGDSQSLLEFSRSKRRDHSSVLKYSGERVSIARCSFLGHSYVTNLIVNEGVPMDRQNGLSIAVTRDEVGVLDVNFQGEFGQTRHGLWYKIIRAQTSSLEICVDTKNIVTDIKTETVQEQFWYPYWDIPLLHPPKVLLWYTPRMRTSPGLYTPPNPSPYMRYVQMNSKVRGIIACCNHDGIVSLDTCEHSGKPDLCKQTDFYMSEHILCILFPLAEGEMITGAWLREEKDFASRDLILVLNTSSQRTRTFGPYLRPELQNEYRYQPLLEKNAYQITGFCYNDRGRCSSVQRRFGVTSADEPLETLPDEPFQATHTLPNLPILYWFKSSASFTGVSHVRLCVDTKKPHEPTVGMLLLYEDRQESLGQWRYDCEIRDYELDGRMHFFSGETKLGPYTKISCNDEMKDGWIEIPQTAEVLWWFKSNCSRLEIVSV